MGALPLYRRSRGIVSWDHGHASPRASLHPGARRRRPARGRLRAVAGRLDGLREPAVQRLLDAIGSVLAGDAAGGAPALDGLELELELEEESLRWAALLWQAAGALSAGALDRARAAIRQALLFAREPTT